MPPPSSDERRLIVLAWSPGMTLELDYNGDFADWEVIAALEEALRLVRDVEEE